MMIFTGAIIPLLFVHLDPFYPPFQEPQPLCSPCCDACTQAEDRAKR